MDGDGHFELRPPTTLRSPQSKLVYLYLAAGEEATVGELHEALGLPKTTLLPVLSALRDHGMLTRTDRGYAVVDG